MLSGFFTRNKYYFFIIAVALCGDWHPLVWLFSFLHGYDLFANQFDFMLHIILAGIGMFLLIKHVVKDERSAFIIACSYMLSGFFVGNAQHLGYLVSGTWIPFVLFYYAKMVERPDFKDAIRCALCFFMMTTGAYPAFTIILSYCLLFLFFIRVTRNYIKKPAFRTGRDFSSTKKFISANVLFLVLSLIFSSAILLSEYISKDFINRSEKLPLDVANICPFSPQSLISGVLPLSTTKNADFFATDMSMANLYFGIFCLAVFFVALFRKKTTFEKVI